MEEGVTQFKDLIFSSFDIAEKDIRTFSPLGLAFIGDAVHTLVIRTLELEKGNRQVRKLHNDTSVYVCAAAQSRAAAVILPELTEEEAAIYRRGRNAAPASHTRSAGDKEYAEATGFEAVCGYLFLTGRTDRLLSLIREAVEAEEDH
ncbi:MAG: ribonuclease III [Lachnospiraceae bacterium]|nr:ribonuclease III [Lachnospiraceae bacterium]